MFEHHQYALGVWCRNLWNLKCVGKHGGIVCITKKEKKVMPYPLFNHIS